MSKVSAVIALGMGTLGLLAGFSAKRQATSGAWGGDAEAVRESAGNHGSSISTGAAPDATPLPEIHSSESLETLIAQGKDVTYSALAFWLLDASAADIATYWESVKNDKLDGDKNRLIFVNWTRMDPYGAVRAVAGTDKESMCWWSWAAHDPHAALAAAGGENVGHVARGIGEFHPQWLREHFEEIPEAARKEALKGLTTWKEESDPAAALDFLKEQGVEYSSGLFRTLARRDPFAAFDWLERNGGLDPKNSRQIDDLLYVMKSEHPEALERLAAQAPSGALKWKIEDSLFASLIASDPAAALAKAKEMKSPLMMAKRLAEVGTTLLDSNLEKAFSLGEDILAACPDRLAPAARIDVGDNRNTWSEERNAVDPFMDALLAKDPARVLEMTIGNGEGLPRTFQNLSAKWAERDLVEYANWVNRQSDPTVRDAAAEQVVYRLSNQGHFHEAAEWAMSGQRPYQSGLYNLAWSWGRNNPAEASAWLESANLPESLKGSLRNIIHMDE